MTLDAADELRVSRLENDIKEVRDMAMSAQNQIVGHEKLCSERYGRIDRTLSRVFGWVVVGAGTTMLTLMTALATVVWYQITHH